MFGLIPSGHAAASTAVDLQGLDVEGEGAHGLRAVDEQARSPGVCARGDRAQVLDRPGDVGAVGDGDEGGGLREERVQVREVPAQRGVALDLEHLCAEQAQRAQDRGVRLGAHEHAVPALHQALQRRVQREGRPRHEGDPLSRRVQQLREPATCVGEGVSRARRQRVHPAAGVARAVLEEGRGRRGDSRRFRKGGGGVV